MHGDDPALAASLTGLGIRLDTVRAADVIVARNPSPTDVGRLSLEATSRAAIVAELDGGFRSPRSLSRVERALRSGGRSVISLTAWPAVEECRELVPLLPGAREWWISHHVGARRGLAGALARLGGIPTRTVLPLVVVALPAGAPRAVFSLGVGTGLDAALPWILLTPRYRASRHVILLGNLSGGVPQIVVKAARLHGDPSTIREAGVLAALATLPGIDAGSVPGLLRISDAASPLTGFAMTAIHGVQVEPAHMKRDPGIVDGIRTWLRTLTIGGDVAPAADPRAIAATCDQLEAAAGVRDGLGGRVLAALDPLAGAALPRSIEHGDLGPPNLLQRPDGSLGVIDWETGRLDGLPLVDLIFALGVIAAARQGANLPQDHADAAAAAIADGGWARPIVDAEGRRLGIAADLVPSLIVACWARQLGAMAQRQGVLDAIAPSADAVHLLRHRYRLILERTLTARDAPRSATS